MMGINHDHSADQHAEFDRMHSNHSYNISHTHTIDCLRKVEPIYSKDGKWCYQISIIDYLQTFDSGKKQEVLAKKLFKGADPLKLSATPSDPYGHRFVKFMKNFVFKKSQKLIEKERLEDREGILVAIDMLKL